MSLRDRSPQKCKGPATHFKDGILALQSNTDILWMLVECWASTRGASRESPCSYLPGDCLGKLPALIAADNPNFQRHLHIKLGSHK